jgi:3'-phosphoadenosine 5'-phosphosulfate sulfotransferase (PAPS reductase)/FAD synthetase
MHKERIKASKRPLVCSVSGGKDSIATALWLRENGFEETNPIFYVFADTGWEHPSLYKYYLDEVVEPLLGENFHRVKSKKHPGGMAELAESRGMFPSRMIRFCTQELKVFPIRDFIASLDGDPINIVGIRAQESLRRSKMDEWETGGPLGVDTWRPLIDWLVEDVIEIHQRHNIKPCSLYLRDKLPASRVGCYPCIMSRKDEIRALTQDDFGLVRIGQIRDPCHAKTKSEHSRKMILVWCALVRFETLSKSLAMLPKSATLTIRARLSSRAESKAPRTGRLMT